MAHGSRGARATAQRDLGRTALGAPVAAHDLGGDDDSWGLGREVDDRPRQRSTPAPRRTTTNGNGDGDGRDGGTPVPRTTGRERLAPVRFRPGRRRRWPRRVLILANVVVGVVLLSAASAYGYLNLQLGRIGRTHLSALAASAGGKPFTMLLVGSDSRDIAGGSQFGGSNVGGQRSDTIIVARVVPAAKQIALMSLPRDLWVPIQGMGSNRINAAFNNGPELLVQTIEADLGIPINHYAEVNFDTFSQIAQAVGGVHVWFPTYARDLYSGLIAGPGCDLLNGKGSLAFVRSRHYQYYEDGEWHDEAQSDLARVQRQQYFLKRLADKAKTEYTNPLALNDIVTSVASNLVVDDKLSTSDLLSLARTFRGIGSGSIPSETLSTNEATIEGNDVLTLNQPEASEQIAAFNAIGTTPPKPKATTTTSRPASTPAVTAPANAPSPSSVSVEVVNGSGTNGQAGQATTDLQGAGYQATTQTGTRAYVGASNVIHYAPDSLAAAQALAAKLTGGAQLVSDASLTPTSYNLELITGSSFAGLGGGGSTPATTAPSTTQTTTSTGAANDPAVTNYTLPGTPQGEQPPASCTP